MVYGCSPDGEESHRKFIAKRRLRVGLLCDPGHEVMEKYESWGEKNMYGRVTVGVIRSTVLIAPGGKVAHHWRRVKSKGHAASVAKKIAELQTAG